MLKARNELLKKYDVTLTAHYQKTVSVYAESPEQAKEKTKIILFDTDLINFTDDGFCLRRSRYYRAERGRS